MINDPRRTAMSLMRSMAMTRWVSHYADTQGRLGGVDMIDTARIVMQHGSSTQQSMIVHIATNSIHHHLYIDEDAIPRRITKLVQLKCSATCATNLTVAHLAVCRHHMAYRNTLRDAIIDLVDRHECTHDWLRFNIHHTLHRMMMVMLPPSSPLPIDLNDAQHIRNARTMVGAFTCGESDAAAKRIGFDDISDGRIIMTKLRLLCLDHIHQYYHKLKQTYKL